MSDTWATVAAALGSSALTGALGFGALWWQQRRTDRAGATAARFAACNTIAARSSALVSRVNVLQAMLRRAPTAELGLRERPSLIELHDWLGHDLLPMNDAHTTLQLLGAKAEADASSELLTACTTVLELGTTPGTKRGPLRAAFKGIEWTPEEQAALDSALKDLSAARAEFVEASRQALASPPK